ncbi:class I SAM-dependent methyltransferase [Rhizobium lusitanum]|uniref:Methyltransferase domain-containing protein n=1 Tax=Rhizobium lusitanum TaxID=293958 RepID=A0A1C3XFD9_9HYPH|nr:class I SAM-dependent methyltransferase [Rhizobium lusitanum]SCB50958.1 Methyltransferase domain-containing protein [Rhizobium lusitanum]
MFIHINSGIGFRDFITQMVRSKRARTYLEVGVRDGATLTMIDCDAIGVDPYFQFTVNPAGKKRALYLFQETSDEFFRDRDVKAIMAKPIDVVFLDGLHQFEYLLRDFINSERVCHSTGLIMLDDCLPVNAEMTEREHRPEKRLNADLAQWWTGDVWKLVPILKKWRPDLRITLVDTNPTGNVCITNLDPSSTVLKDNFYKIVDEYRNIHMNDEVLQKFYEENEVISTSTVLNGFDASYVVGP